MDSDQTDDRAITPQNQILFRQQCGYQQNLNSSFKFSNIVQSFHVTQVFKRYQQLKQYQQNDESQQIKNNPESKKQVAVSPIAKSRIVTIIQNRNFNEGLNDTSKQQEIKHQSLENVIIRNMGFKFGVDGVKLQSEYSNIQQLSKSQKQQTNNQKDQKQKQKEFKKSNAYKNFANKFVDYFKQKKNIQQLLQLYRNQFIQSQKDQNSIQKQKDIAHHKYKNMCDNINKKVKKQKRAQKLTDLKSMLEHQDPICNKFILDSCQKFLAIYPQIVDNSPKMQFKQENKQTIKQVIPSIINQVKSQLTNR